MYLSYKERLELDPGLKNVNDWLTIDLSLLPASIRHIALRNLKIVSKISMGEKAVDVAKELNISPATINKTMNRVFGGDHNNPPALTKGLIPYSNINKPKRRSEISSYANTIGARCSFKLLLDTVPGLNEKLNDSIKLYVKKAKHGENLTATRFHKIFLMYLSDHNWPKDKYPFDQKKLAYESCRKYFHHLIAKHSIPDKKKSNLSTTLPISRAYDEIQIDSQTLDLHVSAVFDFKGIITPHRLSRVTLFLAIDVATDCILAYKLCLTDSPTQSDLLDLLVCINKKWKNRKLNTPDISYTPGACLPSQIGKSYQCAGIGTISLDNALCHHSKTIHDYICKDMSATIKYGLPAHPKTRNVVEFAFNRLNKYLHRFSCTTGSSPVDPKKESMANAKRPPIVSIQALNDILSVVLTHHNTQPQNRLMGHSPLSMVKYQMSNRLLRLNHNFIEKPPSPYIREKRVRVCWSPKEKRIPYIHFEGLRYSALNVFDPLMVNKKIIIKFDQRDIRSVNAFTIHGDYLGKIHAPKSWQHYKHSIESRRFINNLIKEKKIKGFDPLHGVFEYLYKHKELPKEALKLTNLFMEFSNSNTFSAANDEKYSQAISKTKDFKKIIRWQPQIIKRGDYNE